MGLQSLDEINSRLNRGGPGDETVEESSATAGGAAAATSSSPPASAESVAASTTAGTAVTTTAGSVDNADDPENHDHNHDHDRRLQQRRRAEELGKTPATTSTSDLLLLNDNMAAITETEEIAGLTNGHGVLYNFE
ncbi:hypothetical protein PMKS-002452 [Pichia membranifaciens]|uniref:Uncharacterized protein n=1 Tax=Pichia membranifaciens TaxID=4926 RepID=A0A1Q2YHG4_9ASCO|nr:hypothetical protein PMKS-002452 [Pichia membranifaciens]